MAGRKTKEREREIYNNIKNLHSQGKSKSEIARICKTSTALVTRHLRKLALELEELGVDRNTANVETQWEIALDLKQCRDRLRLELSKEDTDSLLISRLTERETMLQNLLFNAQQSTRQYISLSEVFPDRTKQEQLDMAQQIADIIMNYTVDGNLSERLKTKSHWSKYL